MQDDIETSRPSGEPDNIEWAKQIARGLTRNRWPTFSGEFEGAALLAMVKAEDRYDPEKGSFQAFARTSVAGAVIEEQRRLKPLYTTRSGRYLGRVPNEVLAMVEDSVAEKPVEAVDWRDERELIASRLTEKQARVFLATYGSETYAGPEEVSRLLGIKPPAVIAMRDKVLAMLRGPCSGGDTKGTDSWTRLLQGASGTGPR